MSIDHCIHALNQLKYKKYKIFEFRFVVFLLNAVLEVLLPFRDAKIKSCWRCHKFYSILLKLHNLVMMVNCHKKKVRHDWMKLGQLLHPTIH